MPIEHTGENQHSFQTLTERVSQLDYPKAFNHALLHHYSQEKELQLNMMKYVII